MCHDKINICKCGFWVSCITKSNFRCSFRNDDFTEDYLPELTSFLATYGIAFIILPPLNKQAIYPLTFKDGKKIILAFALNQQQRGDFWTSLFSELYLIFENILPSKKEPTPLEKQHAASFATQILQHTTPNIHSHKTYIPSN